MEEGWEVARMGVGWAAVVKEMAGKGGGVVQEGEGRKGRAVRPTGFAVRPSKRHMTRRPLLRME